MLPASVSFDPCHRVPESTVPENILSRLSTPARKQSSRLEQVIDLSKVVFISYANDAMAYSLQRIGRKARHLGIFDDVILYTPADVPSYVKESPLFQCARGAGYWCWKPALIHETLQRLDEGDIVVYVDAGCTLRSSSEWELLLRLMEHYDTIGFQYAEHQPQWERWGAGSARIKHWTKKKTLEFVQAKFQDKEIGELCQVMGGILFMKGKDNAVLRTWKELIFSRPDLIEDPSAEELQDQYPEFAGHRHDQAILTPLACKDPHTLVLPEISEAYRPDSFVWASRIRARNVREYAAIQVKHYLRIWLGDKLFEKIKGSVK